MRVLSASVFLLCLSLLAPPLHGRDASTLTVPASGVIGVGDAQLTADFWVGQLKQPDRLIMDHAAITAQNAHLFKRDASMHVLQAIPATLTRDQVSTWIKSISSLPDQPMYDDDNQRIPGATFKALEDALALDTIPAQQKTRYGLIVKRAVLRTFPATLRVHNRPDNRDIDRFQETAEFPGTPVVIAHTSRDGKWLFVVSPRYAAWVDANKVAEGDADTVLGYADTKDGRVMTGANVRTVFTPEQPALSELRLGMGSRIPLAARLPADQPVNGQSAYASWTLQLPVRQADGSLKLQPALLQRAADSQPDYLPLTRANIIRQAFKFLGERYGWGHDYDGRDCSGFVSEVYRAMGVHLPRNTSSQSISPALRHQLFDDKTTHGARAAAVDKLEVGDLVYIPGHVMMVIGHINGKPWVIHDTTGISYNDADGQMHHVKLNQVSVTPLLPLMYNDHSPTIDHITSIVHIRK